MTRTSIERTIERAIEKFYVTGIDRSGKRFKIQTTNAIHAYGINLWRGSLWGVDEFGKRKLLRRVYN